MQEIAARLGEHGVAIQLTDAAREWLSSEGYDPKFGARPLRRTLQKRVESPLSIMLLRGEFEAGDTVEVDANEEGLIFQKTEDSGTLVGIMMPNAQSSEIG